MQMAKRFHIESDIENGYVCEVPNCRKTFSRPDRLARHRLNHETVPRHRCSWPDCGKTFVRNDVYKKHYRRQHENKTEPSQDSYKITKPATEKSLKFIIMDESNLPKSVKGSSPIPEPQLSDKESPAMVSTNDENYKTNYKIQESYKPENETLLENDPFGFDMDELVSSDELIRWLFGGIESKNSEPSSINTCLSLSPNESLENFPELEDPRSITVNDIFNEYKQTDPDIPDFPFSSNQVLIDNSIMETLEDVLPPIKFQEEFKRDRLQYFLENYWKYYHPQFPILNKPSFSTKKSHPILLLSMLTIGAYLSSTLQQDKSKIFSDSIALPLRWDIYKSKEFKPPPKLWVVQSLVLLETYEICCSSRDLHERANLHRGLSIQMLKRSPMFGGNPWFKYNSSGNSTTISPYASKELWYKWIEEESMKRCALATFYLETLHAVVFGHDMIIDLHDVKPTLPCNEDFWRSGKYSEKCLQTPLTLLAAIKSILHKKPVKTRGFGKKIILSGLIALSFEVKDREFELSIPELKSIKQLWQRKISEAFKFWDLHCSVSSKNNQGSWIDSYSIPLRELYESYTHMKHYDFMVYAGAPGRMNVEFSEKETELVSSRVVEWAENMHGKRAIVFIYSYLFNLVSDATYKPKEDRCLYRKQIISHMLVILWCYTFHTCGPESHAFKWNYTNPDLITSKEEGHIYLNRVVEELTLLSGKPFNGDNFYNDIEDFAKVLNSISAKENIVGLLRMFKAEYSTDLSEIAREHSRLLENCINRSLGSDNVFCSNMFE